MTLHHPGCSWSPVSESHILRPECQELRIQDSPDCPRDEPVETLTFQETRGTVIAVDMARAA